MKYFDDQGASNPSFRPDSEFTYDDLPDEYKMTAEEELFRGFSGVFGMEGSAGNAGRNLNNEQKFAYLQDNFGDRPGFQGAIDRYKRNAADQAEQFLEKPQGPMAPMDPTSKKLYDDMMGTGGFLPGNPKPSDYDRDFGFLGDMEKPQGPMIPPEDLDRPPQIYRPPADDPRDPRTKGMYPTGGFDYPPIAPTPTGPMVPPLGEVSPMDLGPSLQPSAPPTESEMLQREDFGKYMAEQAALGGDPNSPRTDDNPGGYLGMQRVTPQFQEQTGISPDPFMMGGIMSQAPSSMTDPFSMDMMASPMNFGQASESQAGPSASSYMAPSPVPTLSASNNNFSNYLTGGMGTGMSARGGIMSMANPMQSQMAMMPQQMMQQGGYAPRPQTMQQPVAQSLSYGQTPANSQSLYGTQTGSQNNQQSLYGSQHNSPFAGASRGYYA